MKWGAYLVAVLMVVHPGTSVAQELMYGSLRGRVLSSVNGLPFSNCEIRMLGHAFNAGCLPDSLGRFQLGIVPVGTVRIVVRGFQYDVFDTLVHVTEKETTVVEITLHTKCSVDAKIAVEDIARHKPRLIVLWDDSASIPDNKIALSKIDRNFQRVYGVKYYWVGIENIPADACIAEYNRTVAEYLDRQYGKEWRKLVRTNVPIR